MKLIFFNIHNKPSKEILIIMLHNYWYYLMVSLQINKNGLLALQSINRKQKNLHFSQSLPIAKNKKQNKH